MLDLEAEQNKLEALKEENRKAEARTKEDLELNCIITVIDSVTLSAEILGVKPIEILNRVVEELQLTAMKPLMKLVEKAPEPEPEKSEEKADGEVGNKYAIQPGRREGFHAVAGSANRYVNEFGLVDRWNQKLGDFEPVATKVNKAGKGLMVNLPKGKGKYVMTLVSLVVARAFLPARSDPSRYKIAQKDGEVLNTHVDNLFWERIKLPPTPDASAKRVLVAV